MGEINYVEVGQRIRFIRKQNHLRQIDMGEALGISEATLSKIENGNQPLEACLADKIVKIYGADFLWIYYGNENPRGRSFSRLSTYHQKELLKEITEIVLNSSKQPKS